MTAVSAEYRLVVEALCAVGAIDHVDDALAEDGLIEVAGRRIRLETVGTSVARSGWAQGLGPPSRRSLCVVVADQVPASTRLLLDELGWGWLDRRGHLKLHHGQLWIDADVPPTPRTVAHTLPDPLAGPVAFGVAFLALTAAPDALAGVRAVARELHASPAGASAAIARLVDAGLLTRDRRAVAPELFWAVAEAWRPTWVGLARVKAQAIDGLVAVGSKAAARLGAEIAVTRDYPTELLAADQTTAAAAMRHAGGQVPLGSAPARLAVAPAPIAASPHDQGKVGGIPVAHPVVVAVTLAGDPARGAEILESWDRPGRVW